MTFGIMNYLLNVKFAQVNHDVLCSVEYNSQVKYSTMLLVYFFTNYIILSLSCLGNLTFCAEHGHARFGKDPVSCTMHIYRCDYSIVHSMQYIIGVERNLGLFGCTYLDNYSGRMQYHQENIPPTPCLTFACQKNITITHYYQLSKKDLIKNNKHTHKKIFPCVIT